MEQRTNPYGMTDDRGDENLLIFEKTWGHRVLAGISYAMIVVALVMLVYCIVRILGVADIGDAFGTDISNLGYVLFGLGIAASLSVIPPSVLGIYVAKHPQHASIAIGAAVFAYVLIVLYLIFALTNSGVMPTVALYALLAAIMPTVYLLAALKIKRS